MKNVSYLDLPNCRYLSNGTAELVVTAGVGPRILRYAFNGRENILGEVPEVSQRTALGVWKPWGGHRLWAAPESMPASYSIDDAPVQCESVGEREIHLRQDASEKTAHLEKNISVALDAEGTGATLHHKITNRNPWEIQIAPWALTIMNSGGAVILPQEPYRSHDEYLLPARPMVLWYFTDLSDRRFTIGGKYFCLQCDPALAAPQKIGIANKQGWAAYWNAHTLFVKQFTFDEKRNYPDYGCNNEAYTEGSFIELESLGPMQHVAPGESVEHQERWNLFQTAQSCDTAESSLDSVFSLIISGLKTI